MDAFTETLKSWQNFYFMTGGSAAALVSLMFVAVTLGMQMVSESAWENGKVFITPSVYYFVSVLLLSCVMLVPADTPSALTLILFVGGMLGLAHTTRSVRHIIGIAKRYQDFEFADWLAQVILPIASYTLILVSALCFAINQWPLAFTSLWVVTIMLLIAAIANTWSIIVWIVEQKKS